MLPMWTGAVGGGTRSCGRGHPACCPGGRACCRAPVGRCHVVLGTFLHAVGVWEGALDVLSGSPCLLPDRSRTFPVSSRLLPAPFCTPYFFRRRRACTTCRVSRAFAFQRGWGTRSSARTACAPERSCSASAGSSSIPPDVLRIKGPSSPIARRQRADAAAVCRTSQSCA